MNKLLSEVQNIFDAVKNIDISKIFKVDLSKSEYVLLRSIDDIYKAEVSKSVAVSAIVDKMEVSAQAISKCLKSLENKEYIERFSSREDRRRMEVKITKKGRQTLETVLENADKILKSVISGFEEKEFEEYVRLMRKFKDLYVNALQNME